MNPFDILFDLSTNQTNNNIFYHMFCINDALARFQKTYKKIEYSLINDIKHIYVNCVGEHKNAVYKFLTEANLHKVIPIIGKNGHNESETINMLRKFCINNQYGNVLYLHSKGVTRCFQKGVNPHSIQDWIDLMEYFLIEKHKVCLEQLKTYDTCGVDIRKKIVPCKAHYSGNFWWSSNSFISSLDECKNQRMYCELNFLSNKIGNHKCLFDSPIGWPKWLKIRYERPNYTNDPPIV